MFKKVKVLMLPSEKELKVNDLIILEIINGIVQLKIQSNVDLCNSLGGYKPQYLYFVSDEQIEYGDYWIYLWPEGSSETPTIITKNNLSSEWFKSLWDKDRYKKIIASTDSSLEVPQIPQEFIEKFIEKWNKREILEEVEVDYETVYLNKRGFQPFPDEYSTNHEKTTVLKINFANNNVIVQNIKNSWSREEVIDFANKLLLATGTEIKATIHNIHANTPYIEFSGTDIDKWIEENL